MKGSGISLKAAKRAKGKPHLTVIERIGFVQITSGLYFLLNGVNTATVIDTCRSEKPGRWKLALPSSTASGQPVDCGQITTTAAVCLHSCLEVTNGHHHHLLVVHLLGEVPQQHLFSLSAGLHRKPASATFSVAYIPGWMMFSEHHAAWGAGLAKRANTSNQQQRQCRRRRALPTISAATTAPNHQIESTKRSGSDAHSLPSHMAFEHRTIPAQPRSRLFAWVCSVRTFQKLGRGREYQQVPHVKVREAVCHLPSRCYRHRRTPPSASRKLVGRCVRIVALTDAAMSSEPHRLRVTEAGQTDPVNFLPGAVLPPMPFSGVRICAAAQALARRMSSASFGGGLVILTITLNYHRPALKAESAATS